MKQHLLNLLDLPPAASAGLFAAAGVLRRHSVGSTIYLRGLIEYSNICSKNCFYCGLRRANSGLQRYTLTADEAAAAATFAWQNGFGSIVIQAGELQSAAFTRNIAELLTKINEQTNSELGITLSLGEQSPETLATWRKAGASRYLMRIETSSPTLYQALHPADTKHSFANRLKVLETLKKLDYQVGTGVMIGLPAQTLSDLAEDLLLIKAMDIDMVGMGPFVRHSATPLGQTPESFTVAEKVHLTLKMTAALRLFMPKINIAATTALQTLDTSGRAAAIHAGANVIMPNITPKIYRDNYLLYENKTQTADIVGDDINSISHWCQTLNCELGLNKHGNSLHYYMRHSPAGLAQLRIKN